MKRTRSCLMVLFLTALVLLSTAACSLDSLLVSPALDKGPKNGETESTPKAEGVTSASFLNENFDGETLSAYWEIDHAEYFTVTGGVLQINFAARPDEDWSEGFIQSVEGLRPGKELQSIMFNIQVEPLGDSENIEKYAAIGSEVSCNGTDTFTVGISNDEHYFYISDSGMNVNSGTIPQLLPQQFYTVTMSFDESQVRAFLNNSEVEMRMAMVCDNPQYIKFYVGGVPESSISGSIDNIMLQFAQ